MNGVVAVAGEIAPVQLCTSQAVGWDVIAFAVLICLVPLPKVAPAGPLMGGLRT